MFNKGLAKDEVFRRLSVFQDMDLDYDSGKILGSMCTKPDPVAMEAYKMFIETNLGDPGLFKGTALMENEVISSLGRLLHLSDASGHIVTGGTEANLMAMCVAKYLFELENDGVPEVILPRSAHFSFKKIASMLSLKPVYVSLDDGYKMDVSMVEELITDNTMAIVAVAGTTELGMVDDIERISKIAYSKGIYLHVDAALGGFIIPFLENENNARLNFDFSCEGVCSITIDPHKMGLAPVPAGGIIFRHKEHLNKLAVETPYLTHDKQTTIVGTRTGAATAATWTLLNHYGMEGYRKTVKKVMELTRYTYERLSKINTVRVICKPELNLISFTPTNMEVNALKKELLAYGWHVSVAEHPHAIRLVLMPHVKREHMDSFLKDLEKIMKK
ncbi:MAG: tyrosine decarboxylase MnfA [Methanosphaera sp. rholeuAM270]|nr:MAG: tyrosine decarboxylase MnfA [Methanosphaera sp. rholeuAM270]